ncbi:MAG TPA: response regulator transcription factor [Hanamia sp.]|jgi:DNA-binding NarL/FixJ family response regulator|nr:response regulator transcription factor [Hanamia sp.]
MIKVFIIDDHPMVVEGLQSLLNRLKDIEVSGSVSNAFDAIPFIEKNIPDVILLDINLPEISGIELCKKIHQQFPSVKILGISTFSERSYISRMIENGASGYLIKSASAEEIAEAIQTVMGGKMYLSVAMEHMMKPLSILPSEDLPALTKREKEVLQLISEGLTNNQIAEKLFISPLTVDSHRKNLLTKLSVNNTASLIKLAVKHGLV